MCFGCAKMNVKSSNLRRTGEKRSRQKDMVQQADAISELEEFLEVRTDRLTDPDNRDHIISEWLKRQANPVDSPDS